MAASEINLIPDKTVLVQLAIFLSVLFGLSFLVFRPITKIIKLRRERTNKLLEEAKALQEKIAASTEQYARTMNEARVMAHNEKEKIRQAGLAEEASIKASARAEAVAIANESRTRIAHESKKAFDELQKDVPRLVEEIIDRVKA